MGVSVYLCFLNDHSVYKWVLVYIYVFLMIIVCINGC